MRTATVYFLFVICAVFGWCAALDCYSCAASAGCGDPFDPTSATIMTCTAGNFCWTLWTRSGDIDVYTRGCIAPYACSTGCITTAQGIICSSCCDDQNLCNHKAIADGSSDVLQCFVCVYSSDPSLFGFGSDPACNDPVDPTGYGVLQQSCPNGECGVVKATVNGHTSITRLCIPTSAGGCTPACDALSTTCVTCCSTYLCNGGSDGGKPNTNAAPAPSMQPSGHIALLHLVLISVGLGMMGLY
ncbi:uncharacterized protein LOC110977605 [Acanthaster planci]|uniref:Uncharacterized protein LOC110977605 n=1 Tax=Acanthaster planci TaxID=133434 RepID=A0A8B7Y306_ACAPL|nr:uncharacterized protein LOC110977605 [Acanthaster planci]